MKNILYVHGASSTPLSFNYIAKNLPEHKRINFVYDSNEDLEDIVNDLQKYIADVRNQFGSFDIIAHSLGGIVAVGASYKQKDINNMVTISSPFAGSKAASYLKWLYPGYGLFNNVSVSNPLVLEIQERGTVIKTLNVITSGGDSPLIKEKNDGVVSVNSQLSLRNCDRMLYDLNHFEVLMSDTVVEDIRKYLW